MRLSMKSRLYSVLAIGLMAAASAAFADIQANRAGWIGPEVARGATFTAHVAGAEKKGSAYVCPSQFQAGQQVVTPERYQETMDRNLAYQAEKKKLLHAAHQKEVADNLKRGDEVLKKMHRNEITREEAQKQLAALRAEQTAMGEKLNAQYREIEKEADQKFPKAQAKPVLTINLQHVPRDPNATVIALDGENPAPEFVAVLNDTMKPFLATCGAIENVLVHHFYRDAERRNAAQRDERPVLRFGYSYPSGTLVLRPAPPLSPDNPFTLLTNKEITLTGFKYLEDAREQSAKNRDIAASLARADYRKDYFFAAKRKPGIVYRYDPYWSKYRKFELARRIFDGDFSNGTDSIHFKSVFVFYAEGYSAVCKDHVAEFREFLSGVREATGTIENPVTNLPETQYTTRVVKTLIDARFADRYAGYDDAVEKAFVATNLDNLAKGKTPDFMNMNIGEASKIFKRVFDGDLEAGGITMFEWIDGKFFENHACDSATMRQMGENILRNAAGRPSLQEEGVRLAGAEKESDPPTEKSQSAADARESSAGAPTQTPGNANPTSQVPAKPTAPPAPSAPKQPSEQAHPTAPSPPTDTAAQPKAPPAASMPAPGQANEPARLESPAQAEQATPANTQSGTSTPTPPGKDSAALAKERAAAMQEIRQAHAKAMSESMQEFQAKLRSANTPQERRALQEEFRSVQQERQQELQRKLKELMSR